MPPKAKFSKKEIIEAAFNIVKRDGIASLTARSLAAELGSSPRPIFTVFENMEEVQTEVINCAKSTYDEYVTEGLNETIAFKGVGKAYIRFAAEQPKLFQLLFMRERQEVPDTGKVLGVIENNYEKILSSIEDNYALNRETALVLYRHLWIYSHGIAALIVTNVCAFSAEEISDMLTEVFIGLMIKIKSGAGRNTND